MRTKLGFTPPPQPPAPTATRPRIKDGDPEPPPAITSLAPQPKLQIKDPTPLDSAADAHMRAAFDKRTAGMRGYEAALSTTQSFRIEGGLLKFEGASGGDVITLARAP
ncbi:MAG TPA: hypothetical protein VEH47_03785 [Candidatus Acidoferrales bacterium]|nr:hypothetical protein [Candidatus Acidoferrales bacterium]